MDGGCPHQRRRRTCQQWKWKRVKLLESKSFSLRQYPAVGNSCNKKCVWSHLCFSVCAIDVWSRSQYAYMLLSHICSRSSFRVTVHASWVLMSQNNRLFLPVKRPQSSCWLFCHLMKGQQRKRKKKKEREEEESLFLITAVWRPLTQMCRWSWPEWLPGACHSSLWRFSAGMSSAGTGFCSVAARTIDRTHLQTVIKVTFVAILASFAG